MRKRVALLFKKPELQKEVEGLASKHEDLVTAEIEEISDGFINEAEEDFYHMIFTDFPSELIVEKFPRNLKVPIISFAPPPSEETVETLCEKNIFLIPVGEVNFPLALCAARVFRETVEEYDSLASELRFVRARERYAVTDVENEIKEQILKSFLSLISTVEAKHPDWVGHTQRVVLYSVAISHSIGLSPNEIKFIEEIAILHNIGMLLVPDQLWEKKEEITEEELKLIKEHPLRSVEILQHISLFSRHLPSIKHHHERWDGKGYPDGLKGSEIPFPARIISLADALDALTSPRPYRKEMRLSEAFEVLKENSGKQFDPNLIKAISESEIWKILTQ